MKFNAYLEEDETGMGFDIISCGHIFAHNKRGIKHINEQHDWLLFYIVKESDTFFLEREVVATEGSFLIFKPTKLQKRIYIGSKAGELYYIHFTAPKDFSLFNQEYSIIYNAEPDAKIVSFFEELIVEHQMKRPFYQKICVFKLLALITSLERKLHSTTNPHRQYIDKIESIAQLMHQEYASSRTLTDYARICQLSKFHFLRVFESIIGKSPIEYRNDIRFEHAKELLENTSIPINEIGRRVGFSSPSYFCDAFKKRAGISPRQYRKQEQHP